MKPLFLTVLVGGIASHAVAQSTEPTEILVNACLKYVRARQAAVAPGEEAPDAIVRVDRLFAEMVGARQNELSGYLSGSGSAEIAAFITAASNLPVTPKDDDPAIAIQTVLATIDGINPAMNTPLSIGYGALFQMILENRQPLTPRLAFPGFLMAAGVPVTFRDLGLEDADDALLHQIATDAAARTGSQPYQTSAEDYYRVLIQLDNLGGKFGRQQDAAYLARKFLQRPDVKRRLPALRELAPATVVFFGDSQTDNRHWSSPGHYPNILSAFFSEVNPSIQVVNAGVGGDDTREGLERMDRDVLAHNPDFCVILFGGNDRGSLTSEQFKANVMAMIEKLRAAGCHPVLATYPPSQAARNKAGVARRKQRGTRRPRRNSLEAMNAHLVTLRDSYNTGWIDVAGLFEKHEPLSMYAVDLIHFSPAAHFAICSAILDWLAENGKRR